MRFITIYDVNEKRWHVVNADQIVYIKKLNGVTYTILQMSLGSLSVKETPEEIMRMITQAKDI